MLSNIGKKALKLLQDHSTLLSVTLGEEVRLDLQVKVKSQSLI